MRSGKRSKQRSGPQSIQATFAEYRLQPPVALLHADACASSRCLRPPAGALGLFDAILSDPPYGLRERPAIIDHAKGKAHRTHRPRSMPSVSAADSTASSAADSASTPAVAGTGTSTSTAGAAGPLPALRAASAAAAASFAATTATATTATTAAPAAAATAAPATAAIAVAPATAAAAAAPTAAPAAAAATAALAAPRTVNGGVDAILADLFALSACLLVPGGRLVFLLPTTVPFSPSLLPPHAGFTIEGAYEQVMPSHWSRYCVVMRRLLAEEAAEVAEAAIESAAERARAAGVDTGVETQRTAKMSCIFDRSIVRPGCLEAAARRQQRPTKEWVSKGVDT